MRSLRTLWMLVFLCLSVSAAGAAWVPVQPGARVGQPIGVSLVSATAQTTTIETVVHGLNMEPVSESNLDLVKLDIPGAGLLTDTGDPQVPVVRTYIAVPFDADVTVEVRDVESVRIGTQTVWPAQPQYKRSEPKPPFTMNPDRYSERSPFPSQLARITDDVIMRDFRVVTLEIAPVQYLAADSSLEIASRMSIDVRATGGTTMGPDRVFPSFYRLYQNHILNFSRLGIGQRSDAEPMLIIAHDAFIPALDSFVEWKTKRGIDVTVVPTSTTGITATQVQSYIQTVYNTWNPKPVYVILVGDSPQINPLIGIESCASDYLFTLLAGSDHVPDVFISRFVALNLNELNPQLDKLMHYETQPDNTLWLDRLCGISSSLSGSMGINDDERIDEISGRFMAINDNAVADQLYSSNGQGTTANIAAAVNAGRFWIAYCGHGSGTGWSGPAFSNSNVDALTNGYANPFIMDVSCDNGGFAGSGDCFAERWMKGGTVGNPHGAVGMYSSSTSTSWDPPAILAWGVCYSVAGDGATIPGGDYLLGEMTYNGMLYMVSEIGSGSDAQEVMQQYVLFGDCSAMLRSDEIITPAVSHLPTAPLAPMPFQVIVSDAKAPIQGAVVCAYKPGEVHVVGQTDSTGTVNLDIEPLTIGDMIITVSGQNLAPYEAIVTVAPAGCGVILLNRTKYNCDDQILVRVFDADENTNPAMVETVDADIHSDSEPTPESLILTETGPDTGEFSATIQTSSSMSGAGYLLLAHDDEISAHYHDLDCDGAPADVYDTAVADCQGPIISNLTISDLGIDTVTVSWTTDESSTSVLTWGLGTPPDMVESDSDLVTDHSITLTGLQTCTEFFFKVESVDDGGNVAVDDNSGLFYSFTTLQLLVLYEANMDVNPGWTFQGQWAWGQPTGSGGDPTGGYTGSNVIGYNLNGAYANSIPAYYATSPAFDCSGASQAYLSFWKWLGVESSTYDHATVEISTNGSTWTVIWSHNGGSLQPTAWEHVEYDISSWAAGQSNVQLRWGMGPADSIISYCGWNLDDVVVSFTTPCNVPVLSYLSHTIDDSPGNNDGQINAGETIRMNVTLQNLGIDATGISTTLSSSNPHVTVTSASALFPDIPQSGSGESSSQYEFTVSPSATDGEIISFSVSYICNGTTTGTTMLSDMVVAPDLNVQSSLVLDPERGDGDAILDPGETAQVLVTLANSGNGLASDVSAVLSSDQPGYITISDDTATFPNIAGGASGASDSPHFTVTVSPSIPDPTVVTFTLDISATGYSSSSTFAQEVTTSTFARRYIWNMDTNPGWTAEPNWAWGDPAGTSGDPQNGYTGTNVYGYNLNGSYENDMTEKNLTTTAIDCSYLSDVEVRFQRWLGVESATYDHASFKISTNGTTWTTIWNHTGSTLNETVWSLQTYDLSAYADGQPTVYLRWTMGAADYTVVYCGWNIDDVEIWGAAGEPVNTPTPAPPTNTPTITPTRTPTVPPTYTPTRTPTVPATHTPTITPTAPPTATNTAGPTSPPTSTPTQPPQPTDTPAEPSATPTEGPTTFTVDLTISQPMFHSGDRFTLTREVFNPGSEVTADEWIILDVYSNYWFSPGWTQEPQCVRMTCPENDHDSKVVFDFDWPTVSGSAADLRFWAAMLDPETTTLIGNYDMVTFGYE